MKRLSILLGIIWCISSLMAQITYLGSPDFTDEICLSGTSTSFS